MHHPAGIVHRDVKPQNMIMAHSTGRVKLIDFGEPARGLGGFAWVAGWVGG